MTPGPSKDIWCHVKTMLSLCLQITTADIRSQVKWAVSLAITDGYLIFQREVCGYVWINIHTFITLKGIIHVRSHSFSTVSRKKDLVYSILLSRVKLQVIQL